MTQGLEVMPEGALSSIKKVRPINARLWTSGQPSEVQLGLIAEAGFGTVINLALHDDPRYALPDEAATVRGLGMEYLHIPVQFAAPSEADLLAFFAAMDARGEARLWIHCAANIRVSAFLGLYRVLRQGWRQEEAFALMHSLWQTDAVWSAFISEMLAKHSSERPDLPNLGLSHFELYVRDARRMEDFYTGQLGFAVTDRGAGASGMVFLSRNPAEHHQLVLNPQPSARPLESPLDHIAFRVESLDALRRFHQALTGGAVDMQTVSHGNTWSIYLRDPEGNRLELFADTPWHVDQPCRFAVDLTGTDEELINFTENRIRSLPGFRPISRWRAQHGQNAGFQADSHGQGH